MQLMHVHKQINKYTYIYIYVCCVCVYMYTHIHALCFCMCVHMHVYVYVDMYILMYRKTSTYGAPALNLHSRSRANSSSTQAFNSILISPLSGKVVLPCQVPRLNQSSQLREIIHAWVLVHGIFSEYSSSQAPKYLVLPDDAGL